MQGALVTEVYPYMTESEDGRAVDQQWGRTAGVAMPIEMVGMRLSNPHPVTSIGSIVGLCDYCRTARAGRGGELIKLDDTAKDVRFTEQDV